MDIPSKGQTTNFSFLFACNALGIETTDLAKCDSFLVAEIRSLTRAAAERQDLRWLTVQSQLDG